MSQKIDEFRGKISYFKKKCKIHIFICKLYINFVPQLIWRNITLKILVALFKHQQNT